MKLNLIRKIVKIFRLQSLTLFLISAYAKINPNHKITRDGITYFVDIRKVIDFSIFIGAWEKSTIEFLNRNVNQNNVVIEVGANIGAHTLQIAKLAGKKGRVIAIEPTQFAIEKLKKNISLNPNISNITVVKKVVSDVEARGKDAINSDWSMNSQQSPEKINFLSTTVDKLVEGLELCHVDLLKIDVDGYDYKVLKGAKETIRKEKPTIFIELCEYTLQQKGDSIVDIFNFLEGFGYECFDENEERKIDDEYAMSIVGMKTSINGVFRST